MLLQIQEIQLTVAVGSLIVLFFTVIIIVTITQYKQKAYKHLLEKEQLQSQFAQTLLQSQLEIKEQTLQHISRELHDNIGALASLIKINLNTLTQDLGNTPKALEKIAATKDITIQLISDLKTLSVSLSSDRIAQTGLVKALETEVTRLNKTGEFAATLTQHGTITSVDDDKAIILYRMAQEILNNIVKHSGAKHISIALNASEKLFILAINDDGIGFDTAEKMNSGGAGLTNLQNRARLINAQLTMQSASGKGTGITIELPL